MLSLNHIVIASDVNAERAESVAEEIRDAGGASPVKNRLSVDH